MLRSQEQKKKTKYKGTKPRPAPSLPAGVGSAGSAAVGPEGTGGRRKRRKRRKSSPAEPGPSRAPLTAHFLRAFQKDVLSEAGDLPGERGQAVAHLPQGLTQSRAQPAQPRRHRGSEGSGPRSALPGGPYSRFLRAKGPPPSPFSSLQRVAAPAAGSVHRTRPLLRQSRRHPPGSSGSAACPVLAQRLLPVAPATASSTAAMTPLPNTIESGGPG